MLELGKGNVMEELDQELTWDILLVGRESFNSNEDSRGGNGKDEESVDTGCGEGTDLNGDRVGQGRVGRFVSGSGQVVWHVLGGGVECW